MGAAMEISVDAAQSTVLTELNGIFSWKEERKKPWRLFLLDSIV